MKRRFDRIMQEIYDAFDMKKRVIASDLIHTRRDYLRSIGMDPGEYIYPGMYDEHYNTVDMQAINFKVEDLIATAYCDSVHREFERVVINSTVEHQGSLIDVEVTFHVNDSLYRPY